MYVPDDSIKVNRFKMVAIPRPVEYMRRYGAAGTPSSAYTGDTRAPLPQNKIDILADAAYLNDIQLQNEQRDQGE